MASSPTFILLSPWEQLWILERSVSKPVSYTHLDVYKRQAVDLTAKLFGIGLREAAVKLAEDVGLN